MDLTIRDNDNCNYVSTITYIIYKY